MCCLSFETTLIFNKKIPILLIDTFGKTKLLLTLFNEVEFDDLILKKHYSITEKECLSVVWSSKLFRHYIYGTAYTIYTDNRALYG